MEHSRKQGRALVIVILVVLILIGGLFLVVYSSLDKIVKTAMEHFGSQILGTTVQVSAVDISPTSGTGTIRSVHVRNPGGFSPGDAFSLGEISLKIDVASVTGNPVVINEVLINAPVVSYELNNKGQSNIDAIRKNVEKYQGGSSEASSSSEGETDEGEPLRLIIRKFSFENGRIKAGVAGMEGDEVTVDLPSIRLKGLGGANGAAPDEIGKTVMMAFGRSVTKAVSTEGIANLLDEKIGGTAGEAAKGLLKKVFK